MVKTTISQDEKQYSLSQRQMNLIYFTQQHQQAILAAMLSSMAADMGYTVTEHTQFELSQDLKTIKITENQPSSLKDAVVKAK